MWLLGHNAHLEKIKHTSAKKPHTNCHRWWWRADDVALFCSSSLGALQPVSSLWTLLYSKIFWSGNYTDWQKWTNVKSNGPVLSWSWFYMFFVCLFFSCNYRVTWWWFTLSTHIKKLPDSNLLVDWSISLLKLYILSLCLCGFFLLPSSVQIDLFYVKWWFMIGVNELSVYASLALYTQIGFGARKKAQHTFLRTEPPQVWMWSRFT